MRNKLLFTMLMFATIVCAQQNVGFRTATTSPPAHLRHTTMQAQAHNTCVIATGVHESIQTTDLEQISIDRNRDIDAEANNRSLYWENETKPMNAEYDAISEYREEMQLDNTKWKEIYESDKDSKGYSKPVFRGNKNQN